MRPQQEQDTAPRGCPGRWDLDPLGLQADITAQQRERGRKRRTGSAKWRSGSHPRDEAKRGCQTLSSDDSEPGIDWTKNKIGPALPKSPMKSSRFPSSGRSNTQPAPRYSQSRLTGQSEKKEESSRREKEKAEKTEEACKRLEEKIILKYPGTYISDRIVEMKSEHFADEARSLRFFEGEPSARQRKLWPWPTGATSTG